MKVTMALEGVGHWGYPWGGMFGMFHGCVTDVRDVRYERDVPAVNGDPSRSTTCS